MDKKNKTYKKYLLTFSITVGMILLAIGLTTYIIDPFFRYRTQDKKYILNPIYNNPGIAKNYDYNTAIIGSSMVQNYDLSILRKDSLIKPVKLASGAITIRETQLLYSLINKEKTNTFIINLDMIQLNEWLTPFRYPEYLYKDGLTDQLRYHFAYESVIRYGLVDMILQPYLALKKENISDKLKLRYSIEDIGNFKLEATYNDPQMIRNMYHSGQTVSTPSLYLTDIRMKENINFLLDALELNKYPDKEFILVLPPYSALYWHITQRDGYYYHLRNNIKYLCRASEKYKNMRIQFFYNLDQITDLSRYSDVTHFDPTTSNYMLENLRNEEYTITKKNMNEWLKRLDDTIDTFRKDNADWL